VYFSWRQEKYQKKRAPQLGLWLPSRKRLFRRGQELARRWRAQTACPLSPKKPFALGCAATGGAPLLCPALISFIHATLLAGADWLEDRDVYCHFLGGILYCL